jgi:hypothetical protein
LKKPFGYLPINYLCRRPESNRHGYQIPMGF